MNKKGISLPEMLAAIVIMSIVALLSSRIVISINNQLTYMNTYNESIEYASNILNSFDYITQTKYYDYVHTTSENSIDEILFIDEDNLKSYRYRLVKNNGQDAIEFTLANLDNVETSEDESGILYAKLLPSNKNIIVSNLQLYLYDNSRLKICFDIQYNTTTITSKVTTITTSYLVHEKA